MTHPQALTLLRRLRPLLMARGVCAMWVPGEPTVCGMPTGHNGPHGQHPTATP